MAQPALATGSLWRHADFRWLWAGDTVSQLGMFIGSLAIPYLAVTQLHAGPAQMGLLTTLSTVGFLIVGLPAGAIVDRHAKRRIMIGADLARAGLLALLPLAAWLGGLHLWLVLTVATLVGVATVFFDVSYQSYLPVLVEPSQVVDGNAKLQASQSVAQAGGPAISGFLLNRILPAAVIALNSIGYLCSALCLSLIRRPEPVDTTVPHHPMWTAVKEGMRFLLRHRLLRRLILCTGVANLFNSMIMALSVLYMLTELGLHALNIGLVDTATAIGGLVGAVLTGRLVKWVGEGGAIVASALVMMVFEFYWPLAKVWPTMPTLLIGGAVQGAAMVAYNVTTVSFRQNMCPPRLLGRLNASARFLIWGTIPLGALIGGLLGHAIGVWPTIWWACGFGLLAVLPLAGRQFARLRTFPGVTEDAAASSA